MTIISRKKSEWQESAWLLGICENGFEDLKTGCIHWISEGKYKGKKWFADPFILDYNDTEIHLLVEEFDYQVHRGRIAKLTINRNQWLVTDCKIILDLSTHLSFPMIWREDNHIFVCPENYRSGKFILYEYIEKEESLSFVCEIMNERLTDATIYKNGMEYFILSTYYPTPNGKKLTIFKSKSLKGKYNVCQEYVFGENIGRNAGSVFKADGVIIRPAQESNNSYGHAISFQKMTFNEGHFTFEEICRMYSTHKKYNAGMHTFNQHEKGMAVIDVKGYRFPVVAKTLGFFGSLLVKLHLKSQFKPQ